MKTYSNLNIVMDDRFKNGASPKSLMSRRNMSRFFTAILFMLLSMTYVTAQHVVETWKLTETMTATLDSEGVLTITTTASSEAMPYNPNYVHPWDEDRELIKEVIIHTGITVITPYSFWGCENLVSVIIPGSVTYIGERAFGDCYSLSTVTIPEGVISIAGFAFENCLNLASVTIPGSVTLIGQSAFRGCARLTAVYCHAITPPELGEDAFDKNGPFYYSKNLYVPAGKKVLYENSDWNDNFFYDIGEIDADGITSLTWSITPTMTAVLKNDILTVSTSSASEAMPDYEMNNLPQWNGGNAYMPLGSLHYWESIKEVNINKGITSIGDFAFAGLNNVMSVSIPETVTSIGLRSFTNCWSMTSITIPENVMFIDELAFAGCQGLMYVYCYASTPPELGARVFDLIGNENLTLFVPAGTKSAYEKSDWSGWFANIVEAREIKVVGEDAKDKFTLSFEIPANVLFSGSFRLKLPTGVNLEKSATRLVGDLDTKLNLSIEENADGSWLFAIQPKNGTRSASEYEYTRIVEIGYTVSETVPDGAYKAVIDNLAFEFEDGTILAGNNIPVSINIVDPTSNFILFTEASAYAVSGSLNIQSPFAETVQVYSISGTLIQRFQKPEGKASFPTDQSKGALLILKGSSGWTKKVIVQ